MSNTKNMSVLPDLVGLREMQGAEDFIWRHKLVAECL